MASDLVVQILSILASKDELPSAKAFPGVPSTTVKSALDRLHSRDMVVYETLEKDEANLTPEGAQIAAHGSHEAKVFEAVLKAVEGLQIDRLPGLVGKESAKVGQGKAFKEGWVKKDKKGILIANVDSIIDTTQEQLREIATSKTHSPSVLADLRKRKLILMGKVISYKITKGPKYAREIPNEETDLTYEMLASDTWKHLAFKPYNFKALGVPIPCGAVHPLNKVRHEFRQIFFEMGFEEMPTNRFVETGFWNFDALFVPQQHPARDLQDTFYISDPLVGDKPGMHATKSAARKDDPVTSSEECRGDEYRRYWDDIKSVHETGKFGSIGYRYPWREEEAKRLVLRTHTTAISAEVLHRLAADPRPARYFSIDRVFRNETVDATHLAEFHQVEGVIADFGLTLGGLIGFMEAFFAKMGVHNLRFKPAYNPYTEPSMEIFGWHEGLARWVEIGNSGMFRPEMLEPMGLPKDMRVYGWGLSLERPTMIKYGVKNIRELLGHRVDLSFVEHNPAVRLERD